MKSNLMESKTSDITGKKHQAAMMVKSLYRYPVKSLAGESLNQADILAKGMAYDRRWMLVDQKGKFLSQRKWPRMALLTAVVEQETVLLTIPDQGPYRLVASKQWRQVTIWNDQLKALIADGPINEALSRFLKIHCQLVLMSDQQPRVISDLAAEGVVSFADGFPFLLIGSASLVLLNAQLSVPVSMKNFRPNIVVKTDIAHQEDDWDELKIGEVQFKNVKLCSRCILITINPETAKFSKDKEPMITLLKYRKIKAGVNFGCNLVALNEGTIYSGDTIEVMSYHPRN